jgi:hypothetical protein
MKVPVLKKNWTHEGPRKKGNISINIAMPSCYPNKRERDPKKEYSISTPSTFHICARS